MKRIFRPGASKIGLFLVVLLILMVSLVFSGVIAFGQTASPTPTVTPVATPSPTTPPQVTILPIPTTTPALQTTFGKVVSIASDNTSFTVQSDNQFQVTVKVDQNTTYMKFAFTPSVTSNILDMIESMMGQAGMLGMPGMSGTSMMPGNLAMLAGLAQSLQPAVFSDIAVGDFVVVRGMSGTNLAMQVFIIKTSLVQHIQGTITAVSSNSLTITPSTGSAVTLSWDTNTRFILKGLTSVQTGQFANALYDGPSNTAEIVSIRTAPLTPTTTPTSTPTSTASPVVTPSPTPTVSPSASPSVSPSPTPSASPSVSPSASPTVSPSASPSVTPVVSPTSTASPTSSPTSTASPTATSKQINIDASNFTGKPVNMGVGDMLVITLPSNASTGFSWELVQISDPTVMQKVSSQYVPATSGLPGAPGTEVWTFTAVKTGTTGILMQYSQPFAGGTKGAQTFSMTAIVQ